MVLPPAMSEIFQKIRDNYTQTCSKMEQLTLALFMEKGFYQTNIKKLRSLYAQKLQTILRCLKTDFTDPINSASVLTVIVRINSKKNADVLCAEARSLGITAFPAFSPASANTSSKAPSDPVPLVLYYNQIPLKDIPEAVRELLENWRA